MSSEWVHGTLIPQAPPGSSLAGAGTGVKREKGQQGGKGRAPPAEAAAPRAGP